MILEFEQSLCALEAQIQALKNTSNPPKIIQTLENQHKQLLQALYEKLSPWEIVQVARHPERPKGLDYITHLFTSTFELEGDRAGHTDQAVMTILAKFRGRSVLVIAQEKGKDLESRQKHNFGMVGPAGYRKVKRCVELASKWQLPIITFIDTSGAYPCKEAEEFGQAEAIASCMAAFFKAQVPIICCVIGEGGSGGAIGIGVGNVVMMLEYSIYSIAAPEAVSSILWKNPDNKEIAAQALKLTAKDLKEMGFIDLVVQEGIGGAHREPLQAINSIGEQIELALNKCAQQDGWLLLKSREEKFFRMGI